VKNCFANHAKVGILRNLYPPTTQLLQAVISAGASLADAVEILTAAAIPAVAAAADFFTQFM
jgi:hypothetical protein